ncbi:MAG: glycolate oxidase subunit GlcF [Proteobacteria bacterium]|nr:glycolate oxidase subunit GlcF [Pseudomonadota bacterium]
MRTDFSLAQLADPHLAEVENNLRKCVHCGICTATCPTYVLLGDERDSPRGRIVMMQKMLEEGGAPSAETVLHVDRCLSCLGCRTACPSGVDYARLVDTARAHIETHYRRPLRERLLRWFIAKVMPHPGLMREGTTLAKAFSPVARVLPGRLGAMARMALKAPPPRRKFRTSAAPTHTRRVALLPGCVQQTINPYTDQSVKRLLARRGISAVTIDAGCCGALVHHLGREEDAKHFRKKLLEAFEWGNSSQPFEAVLISATGCASHIKEIAHLFQGDPKWFAGAKKFASKLRDISELAEPRLVTPPRKLRIAYHAPCSLQHGLKLSGKGEALLAAAGHEVMSIPEGHLCCGSAGSYSILQPEIASALRTRKLANAESTHPDVIVSSNVGCIHHLSGGAVPVLHLAEVIDWSEGGPTPRELELAESKKSR